MLVKVSMTYYLLHGCSPKMSCEKRLSILTRQDEWLVKLSAMHVSYFIWGAAEWVENVYKSD